MKWGMQTMEEGRLKFIREALKRSVGLTFVDLCHKYGISRKTSYKWLERFSMPGELGLSDSRGFKRLWFLYV